MNVARNGFAKIGFHVVHCCSDYINMIRFQSGLHKNRIWADSLNEAFVPGQLQKREMIEVYYNSRKDFTFC